MTHDALFAFEQDFVDSLRCIPMAVRMKLDRCGIKLSLRQWSRFTRGDRRALLERPCASAAEIEAYRHGLVELVAARAGEAAKALMDPPLALREAAGDLPETVTVYARSVGAPPVAGCDWTRLTELQRFALIKLTRDKHENANFLPAMREFGLAPAAPKRLAYDKSM